MNLVRKLAVVIVVMLSPMAANADLINLGIFTRDTNTGLDWLDVTVTQGLTYNEVLSGAGGYLDDGWQVASGDQFANLAGTYVGTAAFDMSSNLANLIIGGRALALLGCTLSVNTDFCGYQAFDVRDPIAFGVLGAFDDLGGDNEVGFGSIVIRVFDTDNALFGGSTIMWDYFEDFYARDRREPQVGVYLVRPTTVPEPGTLALLGIGLFGMGAARRRKKA